MALDTLKFAKRLQEAGVPAQQAEVQADALWEAIEDTLATKQDIQQVRQEIREAETRLDGRIDALEARIDGRFKEIQGQIKLLSWMVGFSLLIGASILLKLFVG